MSSISSGVTICCRAHRTQESTMLSYYCIYDCPVIVKDWEEERWTVGWRDTRQRCRVVPSLETIVPAELRCVSSMWIHLSVCAVSELTSFWGVHGASLTLVQLTKSLTKLGLQPFSSPWRPRSRNSSNSFSPVSPLETPVRLPH